VAASPKSKQGIRTLVARMDQTLFTPVGDLSREQGAQLPAGLEVLLIRTPGDGDRGRIARHCSP